MTNVETLIQKLEETFQWNGRFTDEELVKIWKDHIDKIFQALGQASNTTWDAYRTKKAEELKSIGNAELQSGKNDKAVLWFTGAILLAPESSSSYVYHSNRSAAYANQGKYDEALKDANRVIQLNPQWPKGYSRKGVACYFLKRYDEALAAYEAGLKLDPSNETMKSGVEQVKLKVRAQDANEKGEEFLAKGKAWEAIGKLDEAVSLDPTEAAFLTNRSDAQLKAGRPSLALTDADLAISLRPQWAKGYQRRGEALARLDRYEEAAAAYAAAIQCDPSSPSNTKLQTELNNAITEGVRLRARKDMEAKVKKNNEKEK